MPGVFKDRGGTLKDWQDFLYIAMTRFARQNWCASVPEVIRHWISHKHRGPKVIKAPGLNYDENSEVGWPNQSKRNDRRQLVRLLAQGLGLSLDTAVDRQIIDECLACAWSHFVRVSSRRKAAFCLTSMPPPSPRFGRRSHARSSPVYSVTKPRGLSPIPKTRSAPFSVAEHVRLPVHPFPLVQSAGVPGGSPRN